MVGWGRGGAAQCWCRVRRPTVTDTSRAVTAALLVYFAAVCIEAAIALAVGIAGSLILYNYVGAQGRLVVACLVVVAGLVRRVDALDVAGCSFSGKS